MTESEEGETEIDNLHDVESNEERIRILEEKVEQLREEVDFIIERNGLRELIENE